MPLTTLRPLQLPRLWPSVSRTRTVCDFNRPYINGNADYCPKDAAQFKDAFESAQKKNAEAPVAASTESKDEAEAEADAEEEKEEEAEESKPEEAEEKKEE